MRSTVGGGALEPEEEQINEGGQEVQRPCGGTKRDHFRGYKKATLENGDNNTHL